MNRLKNYFQQIGRTNIQIHRKIIQYLFLITTVAIGVQFSLFVIQLNDKQRMISVDGTTGQIKVW